MLPLNDEQRILVEENMGLVGKVIKDCLQNPSAQGCYTYDDLFQIGCIGLCKAAQTDRPGRGAFSTYAYILIRNEIYNELERGTGTPGRCLPAIWNWRMTRVRKTMSSSCAAESS